MSKFRLIIATDKIYAISRGKPFAICVVHLYVADEDITKQIVNEVCSVISFNFSLLDADIVHIGRTAHFSYIVGSNIESTNLTSNPDVMFLVLGYSKEVLRFKHTGAILIDEVRNLTHLIGIDIIETEHRVLPAIVDIP